VTEADPLVVTGPTVTLRYATLDDAPRLFELGSDPEATHWFSWGPYTTIDQPRAHIADLPAKRQNGDLLEFAVEHRENGVVGVTSLLELVRRDRRATTGTWFGTRWWGTGANFESKALLAALAFGPLRMERLSAWVDTNNPRSQRAIEKVGFVREGVLRRWQWHGDQPHDLVAYGMVRTDWEASPLHPVPVRIEGTPPRAFVVA
jgi:ribosomal-protein-alanine N-acetyltransferase